MKFTCNEQKHHCRVCGKGVCSTCSKKKKPVPERGWGTEPVRVCDNCFEGKSQGIPVITFLVILVVLHMISNYRRIFGIGKISLLAQAT